MIVSSNGSYCYGQICQGRVWCEWAALGSHKSDTGPRRFPRQRQRDPCKGHHCACVEELMAIKCIIEWVQLRTALSGRWVQFANRQPRSHSLHSPSGREPSNQHDCTPSVFPQSHAASAISLSLFSLKKFSPFTLPEAKAKIRKAPSFYTPQALPKQQVVSPSLIRDPATFSQSRNLSSKRSACVCPPPRLANTVNP